MPTENHNVFFYLNYIFFDIAQKIMHQIANQNYCYFISVAMSIIIKKMLGINAVKQNPD